MDFPRWYQPRRDVGAILVNNQAELDALIASGWPDAQCNNPLATVINPPQKLPRRTAKAGA